MVTKNKVSPMSNIRLRIMLIEKKVVLNKCRLCTIACRFEEEILTSQRIDEDYDNNSSGSKVIIGSSTFKQVQAQINNQPPCAPSQTRTDTQKLDTVASKPKLTFSGMSSEYLFD